MDQKLSDRWIAIGVAIILHLLLVGLLVLCHMSNSKHTHTTTKELWISVGVDPDWGSKSDMQGDPLAIASTAAQPSEVSSSKHPATTSTLPQPKAPEAIPTPRSTSIPSRTQLTEKPSEPVRQPTGPSEREVADKVAGLFDRKRPASTESAAGTSQSGSGVADKGAAGSSAGWSLEGRSIVGNGGRPVMPSRVPDIRGTVVVEITVNAAGMVTEAKVRLRGTNVVDNTLQSAALQAARKTRFNALGGVPDQKGTITYHFDVKG